MMKNHEGIVHHLLDLPGVEVNYKDNDGKTLLMHLMASVLTDDVVAQVKFFLYEKKADAAVLDVVNNTCVSHLLDLRMEAFFNWEIRLFR